MDKTIWNTKVGNLASRKFLVTLLFMFMVTMCFLSLVIYTIRVVHTILSVDYWIAYIGAMEAALAIYGTHETIEKYNKDKAEILKMNGNGVK